MLTFINFGGNLSEISLEQIGFVVFFIFIIFYSITMYFIVVAAFKRGFEERKLIPDAKKVILDAIEGMKESKNHNKKMKETSNTSGNPEFRD